MQEITIHSDDEGIRLDRWFKRHFPDVSHVELQKWLRKKLVRLDGKRVEASARLAAGQVVRMPEVEAESRVQRSDPVDASLGQRLVSFILYKDADVIVLNKPAGLAVQGGSKVKRSVDGALDALRFDASERPKLVHRLDKDTSGVLVLARRTSVASRLTTLFRTKDVEKTYLALVIGVPDKKEGEVALPIGPDGQVKERMCIDMAHGKRALSRYRVVDRLGDRLSLVELMPVTGRKHQLRVHMDAIGFPIAGDGKYGGGESFPEDIEVKQLMLHAWKVRIPKDGGGVLEVKAPLPAHMKRLMGQVGLEVDN